ncbi:hypothetical protein PMAYCL1PPCAC_20279, partial [Pristionchus mayeri]
SAVYIANQICGTIFFAFNSFVCVLIVIDSDPRGQSYRKYVFSLQISTKDSVERRRSLELGKASLARPIARQPAPNYYCSRRNGPRL